MCKQLRHQKDNRKYGKDILAIGKDDDGYSTNGILRLKGHDDRDITSFQLL